MGAKDSKRACLCYEDAVKRISDVEFKRVCEAFKRLSGGNQLLSPVCFTQNVLGEGVPGTVANCLYVACGGTPRGILLRDLVCGLVLLTKGTQDEKIRFLWTLYCNDSGTNITRTEFQHALQLEGTLPVHRGKPNTWWDRTVISLFGVGQDRVTFEHFRAWITYNKEATVLSQWLLVHPCVSLSSELETPTFYQTLAGVTHLEERDISELEKCFWVLQGSASTGQLDLACLSQLVSPPVPASACRGLFQALDVNGDGHVDFKELCCGISAACRGPTAERMKFCFKIFDIDRDGILNPEEFSHMLDVLVFVWRESHPSEDVNMCLQSTLSSLRTRIENGNLAQEEFLIWGLDDDYVVAPLLELLFQVCHVALGLRPRCRHHENEIVTGWLERETQRGYRVGQFWYLISSEWWRTWVAYTSAPPSVSDQCGCKNQECRLGALHAEEGIACDESFTSNSTESMGDLLNRAGDTCSLASSSGVSSSSSSGKRSPGIQSPGPIDNSGLVAESHFKVATLTGEGGRLKRDTTLVQHRDFELVPDSLWKALAHWYGGPLPLPRQVIRCSAAGSETEVDLELYPLNLRILRHQQPHQIVQPNTWSSVVGGYGAAALSTAGLSTPPVMSSPRRYLAHTAAFSRLANVRQVTEFLSQRLSLRLEDLRLWHIRGGDSPMLLDDESVTLHELQVQDGDQILLEVRNKDLTWPEELGALVCGAQERRPTLVLPPGATGLHNLGNTCFMNAALQAVSNTRPLTQYFHRDGGRLSELNSGNPLGTRGQVARRYAELCRELWAGNTRSVAPLKLRLCVTRHAPHLGGGGQHDSQELLAWLLDALHEDLNRVTRKQYTELQDSAGRPDAVVASEAWTHHLNRDHSIITDLFYGQLKSKVTCQTCGHESVRFDAFNLLSLPLPMESYTLCEILVVRLDGTIPIKYGIRLNSDARYLELKQQLYELCHIPPDRLLLAEVSESQIRQVLGDNVKVNGATALELLAYELSPMMGPVADTLAVGECGCGEIQPQARSPESSGINIRQEKLPQKTPVVQNGIAHRNSIKMEMNSTDKLNIPSYIMVVHRKSVRQDTYFLSQHKSKPVLFGVPLLLGCGPCMSCQDLYEAVWSQVTRLLSPLPQGDQTNHATDCDDSLGYEFPFTLKAVSLGGQVCSICPWTKFCRGCDLPCSPDLLFDVCRPTGCIKMSIAIDWDPTALHLRYQSCRERTWLEHETVVMCRKQHTEPIDLDHCLRAFTSEERLETKYHCSTCQEKQPATKKLQIWRLPPIMIIHLKRFDYVNGKWVKTQKVVDFSFRDFDPTAYLASVPQQTILRYRQLQQEAAQEMQENEDINARPNLQSRPAERKRLESTSLLRTPVLDENLEDFHQHRLVKGQDTFDLKYQLYAVVSHSGLLNGGHYISYACNPNGSWYCYNDSSCREVALDMTAETKIPKIDTSSAYILFYERAGLDYRPYLPEVVPGAQGPPIDVDLEDSESELRKQLCRLS